jgi:lysyl-tRNA synthetase class 2
VVLTEPNHAKTSLPSTDTEEANQFLRTVLKKVNVECSPPLTASRMIDKLVGEFIEETAVNPTFIMGHPEIMSPLAKVHRSVAGLCEVL